MMSAFWTYRPHHPVSQLSTQAARQCKTELLAVNQNNNVRKTPTREAFFPQKPYWPAIASLDQ
jgi:hypothetical protein